MLSDRANDMKSRYNLDVTIKWRHPHDSTGPFWALILKNKNDARSFSDGLGLLDNILRPNLFLFQTRSVISF